MSSGSEITVVHVSQFNASSAVIQNWVSSPSQDTYRGVQIMTKVHTVVSRRLLIRIVLLRVCLLGLCDQLLVVLIFALDLLELILCCEVGLSVEAIEESSTKRRVSENLSYNRQPE